MIVSEELAARRQICQSFEGKLQFFECICRCTYRHLKSDSKIILGYHWQITRQNNTCEMINYRERPSSCAILPTPSTRETDPIILCPSTNIHVVELYLLLDHRSHTSRLTHLRCKNETQHLLHRRRGSSERDDGNDTSPTT